MSTAPQDPPVDGQPADDAPQPQQIIVRRRTTFLDVVGVAAGDKQPDGSRVLAIIMSDGHSHEYVLAEETQAVVHQHTSPVTIAPADAVGPNGAALLG